MIKMAKFRQSFPRPLVADIPATVHRELALVMQGRDLKPGAEIAITAGSRGINNLVPIYRAAVDCLKGMGFRPFLFAAMGSHGGGTVEGQRKILLELGVNEDSVGAPIRVTCDTVELGTISEGRKVRCDKIAAAADAILVINRVKPHTAFRSEIESGLWKMMAVGMGKVPGATMVHRLGPGEIGSVIKEMGQVFLAKLPVLGGLAIVENGYDETAIIKGLRASEMAEEAKLLTLAKTYLPRLPVDHLDVLIVDEMGKNFSGTGMDVNVIGRWRLPGVEEPERPKIKYIVVLDLSKKSEGNANGIGLADLTTRKLVDKIDFPATYLNLFTTKFFSRGMIPITLETDQEAIELALKSLALDDLKKARVMRISNTMHLEYVYASEALFNELELKGLVRIEETFLQFDDLGNLV